MKLLEGKKTTLLKGLKGKSGKEFDAYLKLDEGNIQFVFPKKKAQVQRNKNGGLYSKVVESFY